MVKDREKRNHVLELQNRLNMLWIY